MRVILKPAGAILVCGMLVVLTCTIYAKRKKADIAVLPETAPIAGFTAKAGEANAAGLFDSADKMRPIDLSVAGKLDWVHWGMSGTKSVNRKGGVKQIGEFTFLNPSAGALPTGKQGPSRAFLWHDGAPVKSTTKTYGGVFVGGNNGFTFSVPATTTTEHTLTVYVGGWHTGGSFSAAMSDNTAVQIDHTDTALESGYYSRLYKVRFHSGSPGQTLRVEWKANGGEGNISLQAATLQ